METVCWVGSVGAKRDTLERTVLSAFLLPAAVSKKH